jgi:hypothetical protein
MIAVAVIEWIDGAALIGGIIETPTFSSMTENVGVSYDL